MRDVGLKPRASGDLPAAKLREILGRIYPEEAAEELFIRCMNNEDPQKEVDHGQADDS